MTVSVLVVDGDEAYRTRLARRLAHAPDVNVVGGSAPGLSVLTAAALHRPDVVLLHLEEPLDGQLDACGPLASLEPSPLLLVLASLSREDTERAEASGATVVSPAVGSRYLLRLLRVLASRRTAAPDGTADLPSAGGGLSRRRFLQGAAVGMAGTALTLAQTQPAAAQGQEVQARTDLDLPQDKDSILVRMQQDLQRALKKPIDQRKWAMLIDLRKCIGCAACTVACVAENHLPPGVVYRPVTDHEVGLYPNVARQFLPRPCMQCENPPCTDVCPVAATYKRPDGVVEVNYEKCIGCRYCIPACPYGARTFDWGENWTDGTPAMEPYESAAPPEYGQPWSRRPSGSSESPVGNVRKCHFCLHRLNAGMLPACTTTCVGAATYFGDMTDPESLVSHLIGNEEVERLKEDLGTEPKVYYLR